MPKSILEIEVNDEQFRSYLETFKRYQDQVKQMPSPWKETGEETAAVATSIAAMTVALDLHYDKVRKLAELEKEEAEAKKKADEEHKRRLEEESDIEKDNEVRRRKTIDQTKQIAKNVADTAMSLGKWALFGGAASLVGGALGLWGLDKFVEDIGRERRLAQGFGVTTGERQALSIQMSRYFDVNSNLENIAEAQADPSKRWAFSAMGVNPTGKDPAQLALEMATRARTIFMQGRGNEQYAQAHGLLNFYSMDELRRLQMTRPQDLAASVAATRRDIGFGISDKNSKMWQDFIIKVQEAGRQVENAFITKLSQLNQSGALDKLIADFTKLAITVLDKVDFTKLGQGLSTLAEYLGSNEFQKNFKTFIDDVALLAKELVKALVWLKLIPDPGGGSTDPNAPRNVPEDTAKGAVVGSVLHPVGGGLIGAGGNPVGGGIAGMAQGGALGAGMAMLGALGRVQGRINTAGTMLEKWGWTEDQSKGLVEGLMAESTMNPFAQGDKKGGVFTAYGLGQWHAPRQKEYAAFFGHTMQSVKDPTQAFNEQMRFLQMELTQDTIAGYHNAYKKAGDDLRKTRGAYAAGYEVTTEYEAPAFKEIVGAVRGAQAMTITIVNQTGHSIAATANAAGR